ncbi:MAG TPA: endonuclease/exonuclease/phosphatase family protein [Hanamia sp.]|jgi:endonuclease/exonuclease/phosphatase family metal-dependent hydrolase|nr:endonuclease/exonuclease/phosphatase family protein [Hanamia sp.]
MEKPFLRRITKKIFVASNIIIGLLFLAGANVKYFNPQHWWFLSLCTLLLPYLLLLLILFILFWLLVKPLLSIISLLIIFTSLHAVKNVFPLNFSHDFSMQKKPGDIRVMSWNVELFNILHYKDHPENKQKIIDLINKYDPDIACLQEMVAGENKKAINYFPDIEKALKFSDYLYSYSVKDNFDRYHHFGIIIFSKFPILRKQTLINNPNSYNSTFQFVDILAGKDTFRIFNVHLQSLKFSQTNLNYLDSGKVPEQGNIFESKNIISKIKLGVLKRASQANFIKDELNHSPYPVIVCGDFNDVPVSYAYETIGKGLRNAFVERGSGISRTFSSISPTLRIDNIFTDKQFKIMQFIRIKNLLSDHFPIIADVKFDSTLR